MPDWNLFMVFRVLKDRLHSSEGRLIMQFARPCRSIELVDLKHKKSAVVDGIASYHQAFTLFKIRCLLFKNNASQIKMMPAIKLKSLEVAEPKAHISAPLNNFKNS